MMHIHHVARCFSSLSLSNGSPRLVDTATHIETAAKARSYTSHVARCFSSLSLSNGSPRPVQRALIVLFSLLMATSAQSQTHSLIEHVPTEAPYVALTFDDGPDAHTLPRLLDLLKQENVKATFFLIGDRAEKLPELTRRIADEGHEIGNHSTTHSRLPELPDEAAVRAEITHCQEVLERLSGQRPVIFRAPFIAHDDRLWKILSEAGLPSISASLKTQDWDGKRSSEQILTSATKNIKAGDIILMHSWRKATLEAMPEIIEQIQQQGLQMVTVSELLSKHVNKSEPRRPALVASAAQSTQQL